jgi:hypothetical protein
MRRLVSDSRRLRERSAAAREAAAAQVLKSAELFDRSRKHRMAIARPPALTCPSCGHVLQYERSEVGMGKERHLQWDYFACAEGCGHFQYSRRTHDLVRIA